MSYVPQIPRRNPGDDAYLWQDALVGTMDGLADMMIESSHIPKNIKGMWLIHPSINVIHSIWMHEYHACDQGGILKDEPLP